TRNSSNAAAFIRNSMPCNLPRERPARKNSRAPIQILWRCRAVDTGAAGLAGKFSRCRNSPAGAGGNDTTVPASALAHARLGLTPPARQREPARDVAADFRLATRAV